jgi:hypothetical protein
MRSLATSRASAASTAARASRRPRLERRGRSDRCRVRSGAAVRVAAVGAVVPAFEVELSWRTFGTYEVEAPDEDEAIMRAIRQAKNDGADADDFDLEGVAEVDGV